MRECTEIELLYNSNYFPWYRCNGSRFCNEQQVAKGRGNFTYNLVSLSFSQGASMFIFKQNTLFWVLDLSFYQCKSKNKWNRMKFIYRYDLQSALKFYSISYPSFENRLLTFEFSYNLLFRSPHCPHWGLFFQILLINCLRGEMNLNSK